MTMKELRKNVIAMSLRLAFQTGSSHEDLEFWQLYYLFFKKNLNCKNLLLNLNKTHINVQVIE